MNKNDVITTRRKRLRLLIDERFGGKQAALVSQIGINQGELSGLLEKKSFGEKKARSLEKQLKLPNLWLDQIECSTNERLEKWDKIVWLWEHEDDEIRVMFSLLAGAVYDKKKQEIDNASQNEITSLS